jgi:cyclopropane-fatty-acyl-phospholipid synthase
LKSFRKLLAHAREILELEISGSGFGTALRVPEDLHADDAFAIRFADENLIAALDPFSQTRNAAQSLGIQAGSIWSMATCSIWWRAGRRFAPGTSARSSASSWLFNTARKVPVSRQGRAMAADDQPDEKPSDGDAEENQKNIAYHYDVSNAFYKLFLDDQMVYTCGYCTDWDNDIHQMQTDKLEMICRKLRLKPGETMLDIGFGWGSLALYAAKNYGVHVTGVTLSQEQLDLCPCKSRRHGSFRSRSTSSFSTMPILKASSTRSARSACMSISASTITRPITATVARLLKPGGIYLHHAITRPAKKDAKTFRKKNKEFKLLTKYIFPGGELDHIGNTVMMLEQYGFEVHDVENWREHYQRTCRLWHDRLLANYDAAVAEVGEVKTRLWLVYLGGCSIAFERNTVKLYQTVTTRGGRGPAGLPPTRADLYR